MFVFFFSSRRRHTRCGRDWSSDVCSSDLNGWTPSDAVVKADSAGQATNQLGVVVAGGTVTFLANGKEVYTARAAGLDTQGLVGYRVNHNLDVHLGALVGRKR